MLKNEISKKWGVVHLRISLNGDFAVTLPGFVLNQCRSGVRGPGEGPVQRVDWSSAVETDKAVTLTGENEFGDWQILFEAAQNSGGVPGLKIGLTGELKELAPDLLVVPVCIPVLSASHVLTQGIAMGECESVLLPASQAFTSYYQTMITAGLHVLQMAFPLMQKQPGKVTGKTMGCELRDVQAGYAIKHFGLKKVVLDPITLFSSEEGLQLMREYGRSNIEVQKDFSGLVTPGWNSWDYYRWTITEEEVLKNAEFIARDPVLSKHVKRIIVDDGWEYCFGEWDANPLFPNGMAYLARELKKMGFIPGLWFAPAIVEPHARIAQLDSDMLARGESGEPCLSFECMRRNGFILDPTVSKSRKFLHDLFRRYVGMGYEYFKLDFLGSALTARKFADATVPRSQIVRKIVEPIYEAVQGKATILGCNYHFEAGNRLVDAVRVGGDIHATWDGIVHNSISVAARFWSNKQLWLNDPDFALCRSPETSEDPELNRLRCCTVFVTPEMLHSESAGFMLVDKVGRAQMEVLLSVVLAAGGAVNLSDNLPRLNAVGLDLARRVVSADSGEAALPLDLFHSVRPSYWLQRVGTYHRLLIINWTDAAAVYPFDLKEHHMAATTIVNFWTDQVVPISQGMIQAELPPRSCLLAVINK